MQEADREDWLGWHEAYSSPDPYYCRPLQSEEFKVDAISCPTKFNSEKGKFDTTQPQSYYPPRSDLTTIVPVDGTDPGTYASLNDLDTVSAATPPYGQPYSSTWQIPAGLAPGDYVVRVEVNKEYDDNASHMHPDFVDPNLVGYGQEGNFGQPSVLYEVPIHIDGATPATGVVSQIAGYSDWTGMTGAVTPQDGSISTTDPGSGEMRLLQIAGPAGMGRVQVNLEQCGPVVCDPPPALPGTVGGLQVPATSLTAVSAVVQFTQASDLGGPVVSYQIKYKEGSSLSEDDFGNNGNALSAPMVTPSTPGTAASLSLDSLKPATNYVLGVRSVDACGQTSPIAQVAFSTPVMKFQQVTGCFIATAAYGSPLEPDVDTLRAARDRLRPASTIFAAATDLYYRSTPPAADLIRRSGTARAVFRRLLGPVTAVAEAALAR
jgi:hypothetical protein